MKQLMTVLKFEYATFVKSKVFIVMTVLMMLAGLILPMVPSFGRLFGDGAAEGEGERIAVTDESGLFPEEVFTAHMQEYRVVYYENAADAQAAVANGDCRFAVVTEDYSYTLYVPSMKLSVYSTQNQIETMIRTEYRMAQLSEAGVDSRMAGEILAYDPPGRVVSASASSSDYQENMIYAYVMIFLLYFGLMMYGQYILTSVVREKTTKTMELLITSCKSEKLVNGKVLGVGLAGLTQMGLIVGAALLSMSMVGPSAGSEVFVVAVKPDVIAFLVLFFTLGFFAYAYVYAALASTVSRMEDANSVAVLPMFLIIGGFLASMMGMLTPGALWVTVLSFVPFFTPMVMFMRVCLGAAAGWEAWLSVVVQFLAIVLTAFGAARIYRMGTLMYGKKVGFKAIIGLLR